MLEYIIVAAATFLASSISFFTGFGLGTILMPVMAIFFPLPIAIGLTAIVHLVHNFLKTVFLWKVIDWSIAIRFGSAALFASVPGALLLKKLSEFPPKEYAFFGSQFSILHICIGLLLILFAVIETFPHKIYRLKGLFWGGIISGFLGGFSGNQGAFRSIFLVHTNLDKKAFIATNSIIAVTVDVVRLIVYTFSFRNQFAYSSLLLSALAAAIGGIWLGMTLLETISIEFIQKIIVILLYLFGMLFVLGMI